MSTNLAKAFIVYALADVLPSFLNYCDCINFLSYDLIICLIYFFKKSIIYFIIIYFITKEIKT
jgi:hypothetical protein